jgi:putative membrane protein
MHGISGHERDMARSEDMVRIVSALNTPSKLPESKTCTPMVRAEVSGAKASCQIFGSAALFTLTLSPKSHDDLPDKIKDLVSKAAAKHGLAAIVVDAHNCLNDEGFLTEDDEKNLIMAAEEAMIKAHKSQMGPFKMGLSRVKPPEWGPDEGMGPCGIGALVVETDVGKNAYLIFDSNNMIQGFREDILGIVSSLGFVEAEVTTSDTHIVNAIGATDRGYNLAGEVMAHGKVLQYVEEVLNEVKLKPSDVSFTRVAIDDVTIIGVKGIEMLRSVVKTSFRVFIMTAITVLPISFLAAALVALLI